MKCLRCSYCCIYLTVMIVKPEVVEKIDAHRLEEGPLDEDWITMKPSNSLCPHLEKKDGVFQCAIHDKPWYNLTPCWQFTQIESDESKPCQMGEFLLGKKNTITYKTLVLDIFDE